jgi:hypothetical protein
MSFPLGVSQPSVISLAANNTWTGNQAFLGTQTFSASNTFTAASYFTGTVRFSNTVTFLTCLINQYIQGYGDECTAFGTGALASRSIANLNAYCDAFGYQALGAMTMGQNNSAFGGNSLSSCTSGSNNVAVGEGALLSNVSGNGNVAIGFSAGFFETGSSMLWIDDAPASTRVNLATAQLAALVYGKFSTVSVSNQFLAINAAALLLYPGALYTVGSGYGVYIGSNSTNNAIWTSSQGSGTTTLYIGNSSINVTSDLRLKTDVTPTTRNALSILTKLPVVDFTWNDPSDTAPVNRNSRGRWMGIVAQDVVDKIPWLVNAPDRACAVCRAGQTCNQHKGMWVIDYAYAVPLLVKAIQELEAKVSKLTPPKVAQT